MKNTLYLLLFINVITLNVRAQNGRAWGTFYGGTGGESAFAMTSDESGNAIIAGITGSSGIASGGFQTTFGGGVVDAFVSKYDPAGAMLWSTYFGGTGDENNALGGKLGVASDQWGNVYLAGLTGSSGLGFNGFQNTQGGGRDAYLVKFGPAGNRIWCTYYGDVNIEYGYSVACDKNGNVYLAGLTGSPANIASGGMQTTIGGGTDAFLVKFDSSGSRLWSTYYGGPGTDEGYSVTTDDSNNVYLAGTTNSQTGIASNGHQNIYGGGGYDVFLVKFDETGNRTWSTYYGGADDEMQLFSGDVDVAVDASGNVFLTGLTSSAANIASGGYQNSSGGNSDAFLVKFSPAGTRVWGTYFGGPDSDKGFGLSIDLAGDIHLAGRTASTSGIASGGYMNNSPGSPDGFVAKFHTDGTLACATYYGGNDFDTFDGVAADKMGYVYACGNVASQSGIANGGHQNAFGGGASDAYLVKFTSCGSTVKVPEKPDGDSFELIPTANGIRYSYGESNINNATLVLSNSIGKKVFEKKLSEPNAEVIFPELAKGIYIATLLVDGKTFSGKWIKH